MSETIIINVRIFDGKVLIDATTARFDDTGILSVGEAPPATDGAAATIVDGSGGTLLPGLIDAHTHLLPGALQQALAFGVTTELDMFSKPELLQELRAEYDAGSAMADFRSAGIGATAPGGHPSMMYAPFPTVTGPAGAERFVADRKAEGSDYFKVFYDGDSPNPWGSPRLDRPTMAALVGAAHRHGMTVAAHSTSAHGLADLVDAGADVIQHVPLDRELDDALLAKMAANGVALTPTMATLEHVCGRDGGTEVADDPDLAPFLGEFWSNSLRRGVQPWSHDEVPDIRTAEHNVRCAAGAGVRLLAGTDCPNPGTVHGASLHHELEVLVGSGLSPVQALRTATSGPASSYGLTDRGRIAAGLRADLLLVDGDPTADIRATRKIRRIWHGGRPVDRASYAGSDAEQREIDALNAQVAKVMAEVSKRWPAAAGPPSSAPGE